MSRSLTVFGRGISRSEGPTPPNAAVPQQGSAQTSVIANGTWGLSRRRGLRQQSKKRRKENVERAKVREEVFRRDGYRCQFFDFVTAAIKKGGLLTEDIAALSFVDECWGELTPHEPAHSKNVGRLNPDETVSACVGHNDFAEDNPELSQKIGWSVSGVGFPSRKWAS